MLNQTQIDALRHSDIPEQDHLIDGVRCAASDGARMEIRSPLNGQVLTTVAQGTGDDADASVAAARRAFEDGRWSGLAPSARKKIMLKWADLIVEHAVELAVLGVRDNGTEIGMAINAEPMSAAGTIRYYAEALDKIYGEIAPTDPSVLALIHREPVGVVAAIIPWNFPLMIGAWKIGPALAAGCTMVIKPAETASLSLLRLVELGHEAGLPDGVLNIVTGTGATVGAALSMSMDVDVLTFTGSGATGRRLLEASAKSNLKRVYLELGGKSPNIVFADAPDLAEAAKVSAMAIFRNSGQVCVAGSRLLVERSIHDDFVAQLEKHARALPVGDPLDLKTAAGAVNSERQLLQNLAFVDEARSQGRPVLGGDRILQDTGGYFMRQQLSRMFPHRTGLRKRKSLALSLP